jgi:hypothetical protein
VAEFRHSQPHVIINEYANVEKFCPLQMAAKTDGIWTSGQPGFRVQNVINFSFEIDRGNAKAFPLVVRGGQFLLPPQETFRVRLASQQDIRVHNVVMNAGYCSESAELYVIPIRDQDGPVFW